MLLSNTYAVLFFYLIDFFLRYLVMHIYDLNCVLQYIVSSICCWMNSEFSIIVMSDTFISYCLSEVFCKWQEKNISMSCINYILSHNKGEKSSKSALK